MKPILSNTEMVRAIQNGTKTATRGVVKPQPTFFYKFGGRIADPDNPDNIAFLAMTEKNGEDTEEIYVPPYQPGDILYVRETWANLLCRDGHTRYVYKATDTYPFGETMVLQFRWHPSIHMPREAARIFLRITDMRVERLWDMTTEDMVEEGVDAQEAIHSPWKWHELWDSTIKPADRALYGWEANPWVWVIEFERCERPEGST